MKVPGLSHKMQMTQATQTNGNVANRMILLAQVVRRSFLCLKCLKMLSFC